MEKYHITPLGRIIACKHERCSYRPEDHFSKRENAQKVLQARRQDNFIKLSLPRNGYRLPASKKSELIQDAKVSSTVETHIALGRSFYEEVKKVLPFAWDDTLSLLKAEEVEVAIKALYTQLITPSNTSHNLAPTASQLAFLPKRVKIFLKRESVIFADARRIDMPLHGLHSPLPPNKLLTAVAENDAVTNMWVREKKTGKRYWWGVAPVFPTFHKVANNLRLITPTGALLLREGALYSNEPPEERTVFVLPREEGLQETFLLHQAVHLLASKAALPAEEAFARWATVRKYSRSEATAVWHGFPLDQMGMSSEELLPTLSEALFFPSKQNLSLLYPSGGEIHESLYFIAGLWVALGHQKLIKS